MNIDQLRQIGVNEICYDVESSRLAQLDRDFVPINGGSFLNHVQSCASRGGLVLEVGGGIHQIAAMELLTMYPQVCHTALEPRPLTPEAKGLTNIGNFSHVPLRVEQMQSALSGNLFDVAFAHFVSEHLEDPTVFLRQAAKLVLPGGYIFCNRIPLYREVCVGLIDKLQSEGHLITYRRQRPESVLYKKGIEYVDLSLRVSETPVDLPIRTGEYVTDFEGRPMSYREILLAA